MKVADTDATRSLKDPWDFGEEVHDFDPETLLATIMLKGAQFEPLYTNPIFFYRMNRMWWQKWLPTFKGWCTVLEKDYEPLWNKEYWESEHQDITDVGTNDTTTTNTEVMDEDTSYSKSGTSTEVMDDDTTNHKVVESESFTENKVSAFDASTYQPHDTSSTTSSSEETGEGTDDRTTTVNWSESGSGTDDKTTTFNGNIDNDTTNDRDHDRDLYARGNIGVTTSQKLLKEELEVRYFNIYEHMSDIFLEEMTVRVF